MICLYPDMDRYDSLPGVVRLALGQVSDGPSPELMMECQRLCAKGKIDKSLDKVAAYGRTQVYLKKLWGVYPDHDRVLLHPPKRQYVKA